MTDYRATTMVPLLVKQATALAARARFTQSCRPEVGRLLAVLSASRHHDVVAELGTGYGVGTAWMASSLPATSRLITIESDPVRARSAADLFAASPNVQVLQGDWTAIAPHGPFGLLFADAAKSKQTHPDLLLAMLKAGGVLVIDDLTPEELWPAEWHGKPDHVREIWLNDPRVTAVESRVGAGAAVILATRLE